MHLEWPGPALTGPVHAAQASGGKVGGGRPERADCSWGRQSELRASRVSVPLEVQKTLYSVAGLGSRGHGQDHGELGLVVGGRHRS